MMRSTFGGHAYPLISLRLLMAVAPPRCGPVGGASGEIPKGWRGLAWRRRERKKKQGKARQPWQDDNTDHLFARDPVTLLFCLSGSVPVAVGWGVRKSSEQVPLCVVFTPLLDPYPCCLSLLLRLLPTSLPPAKWALDPGLNLCRLFFVFGKVQRKRYSRILGGEPSHLIAVHVGVAVGVQETSCRVPWKTKATQTTYKKQKQIQENARGKDGERKERKEKEKKGSSRWRGTSEGFRTQ